MLKTSIKASLSLSLSDSLKPILLGKAEIVFCVYSFVMDEKKEKQGMQKEKQQRKQQQHDDSRSATEEVMKLAAMAIKLNPRLRSSDMPPHMQEHVLRFTRSFLDSSPTTTPLNPSHLARALKKEFDSLYGPAWHCVAGTSFGSFVTHSPGGFVYFSIDSLSVLLFKTEVQLVLET